MLSNVDVCGRPSQVSLPMETQDLQELFGVKYFHTKKPALFQCPEDQLYYFETYIGPQTVKVERGDCAYWLSDDLKTAHLNRGSTQFQSMHMATVVRGYTPPNCSMSLEGVTVLPYVNACSTKQIFAPQRLGDPTLQFLKIPANSAEQAHHIHSTVRVVYVLAGKGKSIVGMDEKCIEQDLVPGMVCILDPMCPHHFETPYGEPLYVVPLHVFSSVGGLENGHPMFNGTFMTNQGE